MTTFDEAQLLIRLLREGRDYYAFAVDETRDTETAAVFALALKGRHDLLEDLVATRLLFQTSPAHAVRTLPPDLGYEELRHQFDALLPQAQAAALLARERRVVDLMQDLFDAEPAAHSPRLQSVLRTHYAHFVDVEDCFARWSRQQELAAA
ncbi:MAG: hypothetical protein BGP24_20420 [Lysobacterales bacterium 69-70]|nr:hypothetical protein [Xanthomonadaceae bacterium]ODU35847.1 MAG: hypothetical protein ABS97_03220 [Xanthomonadaceae bacterium SCN 69-320]ODV18351.1 MAG: hypothetical protein ABT27_13865 [Xanthomonadaceae bacterium SCN 69-25]OJY97333.1 MAG: hypothetical protein BGP24_20420 [Xanthomonadales bacterium 69-70]